MWVTSLPASLGAVLQNTPKAFFFLPLQSQNRHHCSAGGAYMLCATLIGGWGGVVNPWAYTCSSMSGRTSADVTHGSVTCSPLCQVPLKKITQSAVSDLVPTDTHRQTTLCPACCELLDNQAGRKGVFLEDMVLSWNGVFIFFYVLLVKTGPSRIF